MTYRYAMWLQRPPTRAVLAARLAGVLPARLRSAPLRNLGHGSRAITDFALNRFIWARGQLRGLTHLLIMWGCLLAVAITFPLVFGWIISSRCLASPTLSSLCLRLPDVPFPDDSLFGFLIFHGLVWSSFLVIAGVMLAMRRRMRDEGAAALQRFGEDFMPLMLLFAVSVTGLMLTASYTWMKATATSSSPSCTPSR